MSSIEPMEYNSRLKEIVAVLRKHSITKGVTPLKLREIIEDLGPTFIKLGQIMAMHSDILPKRYCDELMQLCSDVKPMPFATARPVRPPRWSSANLSRSSITR